MSLRVNQAEQEGTAIVNVDGSYLYRKYKLQRQESKFHCLVILPLLLDGNL